MKLDLRRFTLVEVVVALGILAISLTAFFGMSQSAVRRVAKAHEEWRRMHLLSIAAEYYLLFPAEDPPWMPPEIFDDKEYRIEVSYTDAEDLPEELNNLDNQSPLRTLVLELVRIADGEVVDTLKIDRIDYSSSGSEE